MSVFDRTTVAPGLRVQGRQLEQIEVYEHLSWPYLLALPFMLYMAAWAHLKKTFCKIYGYQPPKVNFWLGDGMSESGAAIRDNAALSTALDVIYNYDFTRPRGQTLIRRFIDVCWMRIRNAQAVRNRLKIAERELRIAIRKVATSAKPVKILSLAAGSAQGVIKVAAECIRSGIDVQLMLVDHDEKALRLAHELGHRYGIADRITTKLYNVLLFSRDAAIRDFEPDIVDMMGFVDYLVDKQAVFVFKQIYKNLRPGGYFFTCHIHWNAEAYFLRHIINWDMRYRSRDQLKELLVDGDFVDPKLYSEPLGIHSVAVAQKIV